MLGHLRMVHQLTNEQARKVWDQAKGGAPNAASARQVPQPAVVTAHQESAVDASQTILEEIKKLSARMDGFDARVASMAQPAATAPTRPPAANAPVAPKADAPVARPPQNDPAGSERRRLLLQGEQNLMAELASAAEWKGIIPAANEVYDAWQDWLKAGKPSPAAQDATATLSVGA